VPQGAIGRGETECANYAADSTPTPDFAGASCRQFEFREWSGGIGLKFSRFGHTARRLFVAGLVGCGSVSLAFCNLLPDTAFPPGGGERIDPLPQYSLWWSLVEQCSLRRRRMDVEFYTTNGRLIDYRGVQAAGAFRSWPDRIALVYPQRGPTARHEMLHALLQQGGHPLDKFAGDCDGFVNFSPPEGYGATEEEKLSAVTMHADSVLEVSVATVPAVPQLSLYGGHFVFVITATNKSNRNVWIPTRQQEPIFAQYTDELGVRNLPVYAAVPRVFFRPGQTRRVIIDAEIRRTGSFVLSAGYGRAAALVAK
jgi:hypothetical protein